MTAIRITNHQGREFTVKLVRRGATYGRAKCLTHDKDDALVEFYDATHAGDERFDPEGQFVTRYYASTLLGEGEFDSFGGEGAGLSFYGGEPLWNIDADAMRIVEGFVKANRWNH